MQQSPKLWEISPCGFESLLACFYQRNKKEIQMDMKQKMFDVSLQQEVQEITAEETDGDIFKRTRNFLDNMKDLGIILESDKKVQVYNLLLNSRNNL
jgi:hypothetical protein